MYVIKLIIFQNKNSLKLYKNGHNSIKKGCPFFMPRISIIIPFNNGKKYLERCLNNLSKIEYDDYEIILIDDFSNDNSKKIARKYKKVKYFYTDERTTGVGNARNLGLEKATGNYIMFVDVDDTIDINLFKNLEEYINKDIEMIKYKMKIIERKEKYEIGPTFDVTNGEDAFNKLCFEDKYLDSPCIYLIKKELFERTNLCFEKNVYHEDFGLIPLLLANAKTAISTDIYGYNYFQSENSIMRNNNNSKQLKKIKDKLFLYDELEEKIKGLNLEEKTISNIFEYYTNSIISALNNLEKKDRIVFEEIIKEKSLVENLQARGLKQFIKKIILNINMEIYFILLGIKNI